MTSRTAVALTVLAGLFGVVSLMCRDVVLAETQQGTPDIPAAIRRGGLKEAARVSGGRYTLIWDVEPHISPQNLRRLVAASDLVIAGEVTESKCHLSKTGEYITTHYRVFVHERLRGHVQGGSSDVLVSMVGGQVFFEDGLTATVETPGFHGPVNGERLLLFLNFVPPSADYVAPAIREYANTSPMYRLVFGRASVWGISLNENERVTPKWQTPENAELDYGSKNVKTLLLDVRKAIGELERKNPRSVKFIRDPRESASR